MLKSLKFRSGAVLCAALLFAIAALSAPPRSRAQGATAPDLISASFVTVRPDMVAEFEAIIATETNAAYMKAGYKWRRVWRTTQGDTFEYIIATPIQNFAELDMPHPIERANGKDGYANWRAKALKLVSSVETRIVERRHDLSYEPKMSGPPKLAIFTTVQVAPDRVTEFEGLVVSDILPAMKQSGTAGYWVSRTRFGGNVNEYRTVWLFDNYAELDKGFSLDRVLGKDGSMKLSAKVSATLAGPIERRIMRFVPELSYDTTAAMPK